MFYKMQVGAVIWEFGGPSELVRKLDKLKVPPISDKGLQKWRDRGMIPMDRWLQLVELARREGRTLKLENYLRRPDEEVQSDR